MSVFETHEWENLESMETPGEWESHEWESGPFESHEQQFLGSELSGETESSHEMNEMQEMELAAELLEVSSEEELEQFLGKLIRGAAKTVGGIVKSPVFKALGGALKGIAKTALPIAAGALGNFVLPGVGGAIGSQLGSMATKLFEVELEGMGEQEAEFEIARRYVRFATVAARNAARAPIGAPPRAVARAAVVSAARRHAPGLVRNSGPGGRPRPGQRPGAYRPRPGGYGVQRTAFDTDADDSGFVDSSGSGDGFGFDDSDARAQSGRWIRRGRKIWILGV